VIVLFFLSWRLAPAVSIVILVTAVAAAMYRRSTRPVEAAQSAALQRMAGVAYQAFQNMRTVRSFAGNSNFEIGTEEHRSEEFVCWDGPGPTGTTWSSVLL
jgi:ABC-type multidrug transport system fused ATPase/permease subunit